MNTPATAQGAQEMPLTATEPPSQVSQVPPADSEPTEARSALRAGLEAWKAAGGQRGPILDPIARAKANPTSLSLAIRAKCYDCQGQDADPNWQRRVGTCGCTSCPLHAVRPYQREA